jgi:hypothetical protein
LETVALPASINRLTEAVALRCPPPLVDLKNKKNLASPLLSHPPDLDAPPGQIRARPTSSKPDLAPPWPDLDLSSPKKDWPTVDLQRGEKDK